MTCCIIFNPTAARGRAKHRLENLRQSMGMEVEFQPTDRAGHAEELAMKAAQAGFDTVAAAGGDGTVHEVANGLLRAKNRDVAFAVVPLGSANDYAYSLNKSPNAHPESDIRWVDAGVVHGGGRERFFVNSLGLGFSGSVTVESRQIRRLQGLALYGLAFLRALWRRYSCPIMEIDFDGQVRKVPTLSLTIALGHREGSFVVAPQAQLDDGWFDYLHAGSLSRWEVLRFMPRLASGGQLPADHPALWLGRCREVRLSSEAPLTVHVDGEFFCLPEDNCRGLEIHLLPAALKVRFPLMPAD